MLGLLKHLLQQTIAQFYLLSTMSIFDRNRDPFGACDLEQFQLSVRVCIVGPRAESQFLQVLNAATAKKYCWRVCTSQFTSNEGMISSGWRYME